MQPSPPTLRELAAESLGVLLFRTPSSFISSHWQRFLAFGLFFTWLAGVGRYWDNPRAHIWQNLGLGSLAYVFTLAAVLWYLLRPLKPKRWTYRNVLIFVTLTSPPAILYAIPVEKFMSLEAAQGLNVLFLAVVATWRVALLVWFLRVLAGLSWVSLVVASLLPLTLIVVALTALNLEHVVFSIMAGIAPEAKTGNDGAYSFVVMLAIFSMFALPFLLVAYLVLAYLARKNKDQ